MKLFEPITIRGMTLKNRVVMPPMDVEAGFRGRRARAYYAERAWGGAGAITVQATFLDVLTSDKAWGKEGAVEEFVSSLRPLCEAVHEAGAKIGIQLVHLNRFPLGLSPMDTSGEPVAPSPRTESDPPSVFLEPGTEMRALTIAEIETIIHNFGVGAANVRKAGFDFVEFHSAHGYLPCQFFSPLENRRNDSYGGDLARRMRFGIESVATMRQVVGDDYPIFARIGAYDGRPGGVSIEEGAEFGRQLEKAGADVISVSLASHVPGPIPTPDQPMGCYASLAEKVKQKVTGPVIAVGRINKPEVAEAILEKGQADLIAVGRQLIADPFWTKKVEEGRVEDITPCISCNRCFESLSTGKLRCTVNAAAGQETDYRIAPAEKPKKVFVVGAGPGGMEAARVAALRGHQVVLAEKRDRLGGQLDLASRAPYKGVMGELSSYLARQVERAGVEVRLGSEVTASQTEEASPDAVIIATGANPLLPDIPGVAGANVVMAGDVLSGAREVGERVVIIGGELVACDVAEFLAERGKKVTMLRRGPEMATKVTLPAFRMALLERLAAKGVTMLPGVKYDEITDKGLAYTDSKGEKHFIEADTVVMAAGATPNSGLAKELEGKVSALYSIGDCVEPRRIREAIHDGARVALEI